MRSTEDEKARLTATFLSSSSLQDVEISPLWLCATIADRLQQCVHGCSLATALRAAIKTVHGLGGDKRNWELRSQAVRRAVGRLRRGEASGLVISDKLMALATRDLAALTRNDSAQKLELPRRRVAQRR
jgi:hypothetical protein